MAECERQIAAFICPLCGGLLEALTYEETFNAPDPADWSPNPDHDVSTNAASRAFAQNQQANEEMLLGHMTTQHTMREALLAMGRARNTVLDVGAVLNSDDYSELKVERIQDVLYAYSNTGP